MLKCKLGSKKEKGITLVALIITIIVLIILAAVTIITFTDSGLLETASKGAENYANAQEYEKQIMDNIDRKAKNIVNNIYNTANAEDGIRASDIVNKKEQSKFYGTEVKGYECKNSAGVNKWKILYVNKDNIYIVADDYIHYDYCPNSATQKIIKNTDYGFSMTDVIKDYEGSSNIKDKRLQDLNYKYYKYLNDNSKVITFNNIKAVAYMMDTIVWSDFARR